MITVDSHQHFWQLNRFDYGWIQPGNASLYQDRLPADLHPHMQVAGIERSVLVQAAGTIDEIPWLLHLSDEYPFIAAIVGGIDLTTRNVDAALAGFGRHPRFKGVRIQLPSALNRPQALSDGLNALQRQGLTCDLLLTYGALPQAIELIRSHPDVTFVLNHLASIRPSLGGAEAFAAAMEPLRDMQQAVMKVSGYLTSSGVPIPAMAQTLLPYVEVAIDIFGTQRLMYGSDWPVCTQAGTYLDTVQVLRSILQSLGLSTAEKADVWGGTAARVYRIA